MCQSSLQKKKKIQLERPNVQAINLKVWKASEKAKKCKLTQQKSFDEHTNFLMLEVLT